MIIEAREDTVTLRGVIKINLWPAIQAAAALLLENHPTGIIIDCSLVTRCTPRGGETFSEAFRYIQGQNARIVVAGMGESILEVVRQVPGVRSQLPIAATVQEARNSLQFDEVTPERGKAQITGLCPIVGNWQRAVFQAGRLGVGKNCEVHLLDLIKIPLNLPLGAPMPDREAQGQVRVESARKILEQARLNSFAHVQRVRSKRAGIVDFAANLKANFAVLSIDDIGGKTPLIEEPKALEFLETAAFEVSLIKRAPENPLSTPIKVVVPAVGHWENALRHACMLTAGEDSIITVVSIITVSRREQIDAPKPDAERAAAGCARDAAQIAKLYGAKVRNTVERVRDPVLGFLKALEPEEYDTLVIGVGKQTDSALADARTLAEALLQDASCETVVLGSTG